MANIRDILASKGKSNIVSQSNLIRGSVHLVGFPFKLGYPYVLFEGKMKECDSDNPYTCDQCSKKSLIKCTGTINECENDERFNFTDICFKEGKSLQVNTVQKIKCRPYVILESNIDMHTELYLYGAPIYSLKNKHFENDGFMEMLRQNEIPSMIYLDQRRQGVAQQSYIDLKSIMPIHKKYFISYKGYLDSSEMMILSEKLMLLLDLNQHENTQNLEVLEETRQLLEKKLESIDKLIETLKECKKDA